MCWHSKWLNNGAKTNFTTPMDFRVYVCELCNFNKWHSWILKITWLPCAISLVDFKSRDSLVQSHWSHLSHVQTISLVKAFLTRQPCQVRQWSDGQQEVRRPRWTRNGRGRDLSRPPASEIFRSPIPASGSATRPARRGKRTRGLPTSFRGFGFGGPSQRPTRSSTPGRRPSWTRGRHPTRTRTTRSRSLVLRWCLGRGSGIVEYYLEARISTVS